MVIVGVKMQPDNNGIHSLSTNVDANAVSKNHYLQLRIHITVLGYVEVIINRICIPFIYYVN
jgi:hypothetical protein